MKTRDKIYNALVNKNYIPDVVEFESISYYSSGREGGWEVSVKADEDDPNFPDWTNIMLPEGLIADLFDCEFRCYNVSDALKIIELLPTYPIA